MKFHIGSYKDEVLCDIICMDACHLLLGIPWKYDRKAIHGERRNTYTVTTNGKRNKLIPLEEEEMTKACGTAKLCLVDGRKILNQLRH